MLSQIPIPRYLTTDDELSDVLLDDKMDSMTSPSIPNGVLLSSTPLAEHKTKSKSKIAN